MISTRSAETDSLFLHVQTGLRRKNDPSNDQAPAQDEPYEIRVYSSTDQGYKPLDFREVLKARGRTPIQPQLPLGVTRELAEKSLTAAKAQPSSLHEVLPKDHSLQIRTMEMALRRREDPSNRYFEQLSEIGKVEGFHMVGLARPAQVDAIENQLLEKGYDNFSLVTADEVETWVEDYSEPCTAGSRWIPARIDSETFGTNFINTAMSEGRKARLEPLGLPTNFPIQGGVNQCDYQRVGAGEGVAQGKSIVQGTSYLEGGNILSGTLADGQPYVLVGRDSLAITQALLSKQRGEVISESQTLASIADDLGCAQVVPVEQPGEFHLDMRMMPIGPGKLVVQDSREAARLQEQWLRESATPEQLDEIKPQLEILHQWVDKVAGLEDKACQDLEEAGFEVHRLAGAFHELTNNRERDGANFFNARHGTNSNGETFSILMGGTAKEEAYIAKALLIDSSAEIDHLYFLDPEPNAKTLGNQGGMKCRSKPDGHRISPISHRAPRPVDTSADQLEFNLAS